MAGAAAPSFDQRRTKLRSVSPKREGMLVLDDIPEPLNSRSAASGLYNTVVFIFKPFFSKILQGSQPKTS